MQNLLSQLADHGRSADIPLQMRWIVQVAPPSLLQPVAKQQDIVFSTLKHLLIQHRKTNMRDLQGNTTYQGLKTR